ncbi:hypothetical protein Csa_004795 [Cucumis sativus]|uniref:Uncharacterized protein n=1 Tax=Cucumis sativus TaxID=3659 RepID=A0A0A0KDS3_CUCSA|nr:hypothetical protein Csa_004795 [Cucumis sativus]
MDEGICRPMGRGFEDRIKCQNVLQETQLRSQKQVSDLKFRMDNANTSTKAQLNQQDEKIMELITQNGELQGELLGVSEQNEALIERVERLTDLVEILAKRCDTVYCIIEIST